MCISVSDSEWREDDRQWQIERVADGVERRRESVRIEESAR